MKKIILIVFLISSNLIIAQNNSKLIITESEEYEDEVKADIIQSIYLSELGKAAVVRNHKRGIYIDVFDVNLKKESLKTFETDRRENYLGDLFFNDKLLVFTESSPKNNVKILNCIIFNLATGATQKVEIMKPEIEKHQNLFSNKKGTVFALSPNSNYFTLTNYIIHKGEIYFHINVFDSNTFELIFDNKHKRSENQFYSISDIRIDNEKKIFILGKSFFDEENPIVKSNKLYYYLLEKFSTSNYSVLKIDFSDKFVKSLKTAVFDNTYNLYGFYSEKGFNWLKGVCNISIDLDLLKINNLNFQDLPEKIFTDMFGSNKAEKMNKKELSNFDINHILKDSQNNIFLLAEEFYVTSTAGMGPYNMGGGTNNHYDDIIIVKFNPNRLGK
jgi:hypothetical protein